MFILLFWYRYLQIRQLLLAVRLMKRLTVLPITHFALYEIIVLPDLVIQFGLLYLPRILVDLSEFSLYVVVHLFLHFSAIFHFVRSLNELILVVDWCMSFTYYLFLLVLE